MMISGDIGIKVPDSDYRLMIDLDRRQITVYKDNNGKVYDISDLAP